MSKLNDILALLPDNVTKKIKPVDLRTSVEYIYEDMMSQLGDHILTIGSVTATTNKAYLSLPPELKNEVIIDGISHSRTVAQQFPFTAVTTGFKVLIIEARPTPEVFHLVEGTEGTEAVEPAHTGLVVAKLLATPTGTTVEESNTDFKQKLEDYWLNWYVTSQSKVILSTYDARGSFYITKSASATGSVTIGGLSKIVPATEDAAKIFYEGREFLIYNATGEPMLLNSTGVSPVDTFLISDKLTPFTVKNNTAIKVKLRGDILEILPSGSDPDLSGYATQSALDTEIVNRAIEDEKKLDKPLSPNNVATRVVLADGSTKPLSEIGGDFSGKLDKPLAPNNVPSRIVNADNSTSPKSDFQRKKQFFIALPATVQEEWCGCLVFFTSSGVLTVPAPTALSAEFSFDGKTDNGVTVTPAISTGSAWYNTPVTVPPKTPFFLYRRGTTNVFEILGL